MLVRWSARRSCGTTGAAADLVSECGGRAAWANAIGSVPGPSFTVAKLRWLADREPGHAERTAAVCFRTAAAGTDPPAAGERVSGRPGDAGSEGAQPIRRG